MADSCKEVLRTLGDPLAVHDEANFEAGDVNAGANESALRIAGVPSEEKVSFVSEAVFSAIGLENVIVTGDSTFVIVDEMPKTGVINCLVAELCLVGHGFGDGLDVFGCSLHVIVQVVLVQEFVSDCVENNVTDSEPVFCVLDCNFVSVMGE